MDSMDYGNESDDEAMSTDILEYIRDVSHYHPNVNRKKDRYKIPDRIKQRQS